MLSPLRVAVLSSARAPGFAHLLAAGPERSWRIVACVTTDPEWADAGAARRAGVPVLVRDLRRFHEERRAPLADADARRAFDAGTARALRPYAPEVVLAAGYLWILSEPMLEAFPERVLNLHDSDLTLRDAEGRPRYRGLGSTRDAILAGEPETRSTLHIVTAEVDGGPPLLRSRAFPVHPMVREAREWGAIDILKAYAYAQREWMMRAAWGPMWERALDLTATGRVRTLDGRCVVDGRLGPLEMETRLTSGALTDRAVRRVRDRVLRHPGGSR